MANKVGWKDISYTRTVKCQKHRLYVYGGEVDAQIVSYSHLSSLRYGWLCHSVNFASRTGQS
ncbi:hypothetical protein J6590_048776 [Homalodisca vitripennis]|nr:hypothetical protein J6590_048776 [Homalodisca vitripennis]